MGLFDKMKDPVRGTAEVVSSDPPITMAGHMRLIITADGVPPTPVEYSGRRHADRWPFFDAPPIPVTVDRANPQSFRIEWDELPKTADVVRKEQDELQEQ